MVKTTPAHYSLVARVLHWAVLGLLVVQFAVAWTMPDITRTTPDDGLVAWHLSIGLTIMIVMVARLAWRLTHTPPAPPRDLPAVLQVVSRANHWLLYALLIVLPVLGWANASSRGYPALLFGVVALPALTPVGDAFGHTLGDVHGTVALVLLAAVALHAAGALYHAAVLRDRTLQRMLVG